MDDYSRMTVKEFLTALQSPLELKPATPKYFNSSAPYFTSWVEQKLPSILSSEKIELGGLIIRTSLNLDWQEDLDNVHQSQLK